jgi:tRNA/rRNA methyltransferase
MSDEERASAGRAGGVTGEGAILANRDGEPASFARLRVVLVRTTHPGNIGGAARAMKTMGLARLALVAPRRFPDPQAEAMATGADDLLARAQVSATLDEALAGTTLAIALTARRRELSPHAIDARAAAALAVAEAAGGGEVAFVFGTEMSGLANDEVLKCQRVAHITTSPAYSSLNLAAAVQVMAYEARVAALGSAVAANDRFEGASFEDIEGFYAHLERNLVASGFLDPANPRRLMERLRRLFGRGRLEKEEVNILRGILSSWDNEGGR